MPLRSNRSHAFLCPLQAAKLTSRPTTTRKHPFPFLISLPTNTPLPLQSWRFAPNDWVSGYPSSPEVFDYFQRVYWEYNVDPFTTFNSQVVKLVYDEQAAKWEVFVRDTKSGKVRIELADVVINGQVRIVVEAFFCDDRILTLSKRKTGLPEPTQVPQGNQKHRLVCRKTFAHRALGQHVRLCGEGCGGCGDWIQVG